MKLLSYILIVLLFTFLFSCTDTIDNLNQIAGIEEIEFIIESPSADIVYNQGDKCIIKWILSPKKGTYLRIDLVKDNEIVLNISPETKNDGEYIWNVVEGIERNKYSIRLTITGSVYSGKYCESSLITIDSIIIYPGHIWFVPSRIITQTNDKFSIELHIGLNKLNIAAYGIDIIYNPSIINVDISIGNNGVIPGEQGFLSAVNAEEQGLLKVAGFDTYGVGPSDNLHLLTIWWTAINKGSTDINMEIIDSSNSEIIPLEWIQIIGAQVNVN